MSIGVICEIFGVIGIVTSIYLLVKHNLIKLIDSSKLHKNIFYIIFFLAILSLSLAIALNGVTIESIYRDIAESNYTESELLAYSITILELKSTIYKEVLGVIILSLINFGIYKSIKKEISLRNSKHQVWDLKKLLNK